jgi:MFS transporter, CP family, cyanate transporter
VELSAGPSRAILLITVLVVAANLRPTITALGSVVSLVAADTGLGPGALGLLGAVPLLAFAAVSPLVHLLTNALGAERAVLLSTLVLIVAPSSGPCPDRWPACGSARF